MSADSALLVVAVPAAMLGAAAMGLANVTQSRATKQVPASEVLDPRLLWHLVRNTTWLVGILATVAGLVLQLVALGFGPLLLVQPLLVTAVLFTAIFGAWLGHSRIDRVIILGALLCVAGLCAFLLLARPSQAANQIVGGLRVLPLAIALAVVVLACLAIAARTQSGGRVLALAAATGVLYGVNAGLMKMVSGQFRLGPGEPFTHWALYAACVTGATGFLLSQNTFQQGRLVSPAVAVITTVDPLVSIGIGVSWFGESVQTSAAALAGQAIAAVAIIAGIVVLSYRGQRLVAEAASVV